MELCVGAAIGVWVWLSPAGLGVTHPPIEMKVKITSATVFAILLWKGSKLMAVYFCIIAIYGVLIVFIDQNRIFYTY